MKTNDNQDNEIDLPVSLSKSKRRLDAQIKALSLHREIKQIRDQARERLEKQGFYDDIEREIKELLKRECPDEETQRYLRLIHGIERPMTEREKLDHVAKAAVTQYIEQQSFYEEHRIPLILSDSGDLYRKPKEEFCYSMRGGNAKRITLLQILIGCRAFLDSNNLLDQSGYESYKTMTDAIQEINTAARKKLQLPAGDGNKLIISRPYTGYMINPLYPIELED